MKKAFIAVTLISTLLSACSDGVPRVADPHLPIVDGETMTPGMFLERYCEGKIDSATCEKVRKARSLDAAKPSLPKGW